MKAAVGLAAACLFIFLVASAWFAPRKGGVDEVTLMNPVYMKLTTGRLTYPAHGFFDGMYVHPPVHVSEVALLRGLGLPLYYAEALPALAWLSLAIVMIVRAPFPWTLQAGLLTGLFAPLALIKKLEWTDGWWGMRPDWHVFAAWICGLVVLEWGRLDGWNRFKLFAGAFLLTYASGVHYWAAVAVTGVLIYVAWALLRLPRPQALRVSAALLAGGLLFGLPYLLLFVGPQLSGIREVFARLHGTGGIPYAVALKRGFYATFAADGPAANAWIHRLAVFIPPLVVSSAVLAWMPKARGLLLASLPLQVFVYLVATHLQAYYMAPEYALLVTALVTAALELLDRACTRLVPALHSPVLTAACLAPLLFMSWSSGHWRTMFPPRIPAFHEAEIARAAGKEILGDNARVGYQISMWYIAGETHSYMIDSDLHMPPQVMVRVPDYFRILDAVATTVHFERLGNFRRELIESNLYAAGVLHLAGFYWAQDDVDYGYLLLAANRSDAVTGFARQDGRLYRFSPSSSGGYRLRTAVCPVSEASAFRRAARFSYYLGMPEQGPIHRRGVVAAITSLEIPLPDRCREILALTGDVQEVDTVALVGRLRKREKQIQFYRTIEELAAPDRTQIAKSVYAAPSQDARPLPDAIHVDHATAGWSGAHFHPGPPPRAWVTPGFGQYAILFPVERKLPAGPCWLEARFRVERGVIVFAFREKGRDDFLFSSAEFPASGITRDLFLLLPGCARVEELMIRGNSQGQPSSVEIERLVLWARPGLIADR